jgi:hypothetical protein
MDPENLEDCTNVTIVGGTELTMTGSGTSWQSETTWNAGGDATGGGYIETVPIPLYQEGLNMSQNGRSTMYRNFPDVALVADGIEIVAGGTVSTVGGTSASAPLWAGIAALANQQAAQYRPFFKTGPIGFINPAIYSIGKSMNYASYFHDITSGNNSLNGNPSQFSAVVGFDLCTGWGTPNGTSLIDALSGVPICHIKSIPTFSSPDYIAVVVDWANVFAFLQSTTNLNGVWSNVVGATSPYTNLITGKQQFFRLALNITNLPCVTPPSGVAYWWPGEGNALDIWGGNNGTLQGGVTFTHGEVGQAFNLDGASGFVSTSTLISNPQTFSLSLWFRTATTNGGVLISFDSSQVSVEDGSKFDRNIYLDDTGALHFGVWNSGPQQIDSAAGYNDSNWHQVVGSLSASTGLSLYVDGVLAGNNPAVTDAWETYNGYWRFGEDNLNNWPYQPASHYFQGQIDEVAIFNTALSSSNVAAIYAAGSAGMCQ